jgi:hypothetical protein
VAAKGGKSLRKWGKNVGDFLKNVGDFPKNVGDFSANDGLIFSCSDACEADRAGAKAKERERQNSGA